MASGAPRAEPGSCPATGQRTGPVNTPAHLVRDSSLDIARIFRKASTVKKRRGIQNECPPHSPQEHAVCGCLRPSLPLKMPGWGDGCVSLLQPRTVWGTQRWPRCWWRRRREGLRTSCEAGAGTDEGPTRPQQHGWKMRTWPKCHGLLLGAGLRTHSTEIPSQRPVPGAPEVGLVQTAMETCPPSGPDPREEVPHPGFTLGLLLHPRASGFWGPTDFLVHTFTPGGCFFSSASGQSRLPSSSDKTLEKQPWDSAQAPAGSAHSARVSADAAGPSLREPLWRVHRGQTQQASTPPSTEHTV